VAPSSSSGTAAATAAAAGFQYPDGRLAPAGVLVQLVQVPAGLGWAQHWAS
jgi:hypothetical protein